MRGAALLVALLLLPRMTQARGAEILAGEWKNLRETRTIVGARIYADRGRWMVQLLGACHPEPCVWEPELLTMVPPPPLGGPIRATATVSISNMRRVITLSLGEDSLVVEVASHQLAVPSRGIGERRYASTDELARVKASTTPLPPLRRTR